METVRGIGDTLGDTSGKKDLIPFGALVDYIPDTTRGRWKGKHKFSPKGVPGVFLGWHLHVGHMWRGEYYVADLQDFARLDLTYHAVARLTSPCA